MRNAVVSLMLVLAACAPTTETKPPPTTEVPQDAPLIVRFSNVIWPTILKYRHAGQGDPQSPPGPDSDYAKFYSVVDTHDKSGYAVKVEADVIGEVLDANGVSTGETDHLELAHTAIAELNGDAAKIIACYTYSFTARSEWPHSDDHAAPGASEVTFDLHKDNDWLVRSITNDRVVPGCQSSKA